MAHTAHEPPRAAIYARKSREDRKNPGKSVSDQIREAQDEVTRRGYTLDPAHVFADEGISASRFTNKARPGFGALMAAIESGEVDVVVMAEQSRVTRRLSVVGALIEGCADYGRRLVIGGRDVDPRDPADITLAAVQGGMDAAESERLSQRSRRGIRGTVEAGKPLGRLAYGYARTYDPVTRQLLEVTVEPHEAAVVREIVEHLLAGGSQQALVRRLNARHEPTPADAVRMRQGLDPAGSLWTGVQIKRLALSDRFAGILTHNGVEHPGDWPAIITRGELDRLRAIFGAPERRRNLERPGAVVHFLSGVARCGACGGPLRVVPTRGRPAYSCRTDGCRKVSRNAGPLEDYVRDVVLGVWGDPAAMAAIAAQRDDGGAARTAADRVEELTARRDRVRAAMADGSLPVEDAAAVLRDLAGDLEDAEREARAAIMPRHLADIVPANLPAVWDDLEPTARREIVDALATVVVHPMTQKRGRTFDYDSVSITPRASAVALKQQQTNPRATA